MAVDENVLEGFKGCLEKEAASDTERYIKVGFGNSQSLDQFGRLRVAQSFDIFDNKNVASRNVEEFNEVTVGAGAIAYDYQTSSVSLSISQANLDRAMRQTRYLYYVPGKSQKINMTGILAASDTDNIYCVVRTSTSGSVVDTKTQRTDWDDTVLGTGLNNPSGVDIDFSKAGIFDLSFQWLGVGRVTFNISDPNNRTISVFTVENSFENTDVYMRTGSLPMRYEIVSDGTTIYRRIGYFDDNDGLFFESQTSATVGTHTMKEICCSCSTEGGVKPIALKYHANNRSNMPTATTSGIDVLVVRLKNSFDGNENRKTATLLSASFFADDQNTIFEVYKVHGYTDGGTTWTSVDDHSGCEYSKGTEINLSGLDAHLIGDGFVTANASGSKANSGEAASTPPFEVLDNNKVIFQNYDSTKSSMFLVKAFTMASTTSVAASMTWLENE